MGTKGSVVANFLGMSYVLVHVGSEIDTDGDPAFASVSNRSAAMEGGILRSRTCAAGIRETRRARRAWGVCGSWRPSLVSRYPGRRDILDGLNSICGWSSFGRRSGMQRPRWFVCEPHCYSFSCSFSILLDIYSAVRLMHTYSTS